MARRGAGLMVAKAVAVLQKDFLTAFRYRNGVLFNALAPVAQLVTFYYLARAVGPQFRPDGISYFPFLLVGTGFYVFLIASMSGFLNVIQESQQTGTLEVLMTTSTRPVALLFLAALSAFSIALMQFVFYTAAGLSLFPSHLQVRSAGLVAVLLLSALVAMSLGLLAAGLQLLWQKGSVVLWIFGSSAWALAGTLFPITAFPAPVRVLSQCLPFTHSLTGMRLAMFGSTGAALNRELAMLLISVLALAPASVAFFSWTVARARQIGTLSFY
jgi:ABC-2 type transport system permease protein